MLACYAAYHSSKSGEQYSFDQTYYCHNNGEDFRNRHDADFLQYHHILATTW